MPSMSKEAIVKLIFGVRGCGKTIKLLSLLRSVRRVLIVNTLNQESVNMPSESGYSNGVIFHTVPDLTSFWTKHHQGDFRLIFSPEHGDMERTCREIAYLCKLTMACGYMTLAIEELNVIFANQRKPDEFNTLVFSGREPGVELIGVAQRPRGFGPELASQAKEAFIFHTHEPEALTFFRNWMGKEAADAIRSLEGHAYLHWSFANGVTNFTIQTDEALSNLS